MKRRVIDKTLVARDAERERLREFWERGETGPNVVELVAPGGVGKTALTVRFAEDLRRADWPSLDRAYAFSFYSQGADGANASSGTFFADALRHFGEPPEEGTSVVRQAEDLARALCNGKHLLILDGLEPLQFGPTVEAVAGRLKEPAMALFLRRCARAKAMTGMVLISTRVNITNLDEMRDTRHERLNVDDIDDAKGRAILRHFGLSGSDDRLEAVSREYGNHTLALRLLASYCKEYGAAPEGVPEFEPGDDDLPEQALPARRVMEAFAQKFGAARLAILHVLGLFDRPATKPELDALCDPAVPGLTDALTCADDWDQIDSLQRLGLARRDHDGRDYDAHPLIREHFGARLRSKDNGAFKAGHSRLFDHLCANTDEKPQTLEAMQPLFTAMPHGCLADRHGEVVDDVFWPRVDQGNAFVAKKLGAMGPGLAALTPLFDVPYSVAALSLPENSPAFLYNVAGFSLRSLGRLREAEPALQASYEAAVEQLDELGVAQDASNLAEIRLALGRIGLGREEDGSLRAAQRSLANALAITDGFRIEVALTILAAIRHAAGQWQAAAQLFRLAERRLSMRQPKYPLLYSVSGAGYCAMLLDRADAAEAERRAKDAIEIAKENDWLLDIALDCLSLGRARLALRGPGAARDDLEAAVEGVYSAGALHHAPKFHIARAEMHRLDRKFIAAHEDLEDSFDLCRASGLRLDLCDTHLEAGRLALAEDDRDEASRHHEQARLIIDETGYHRRDGPLADLGAAIAAKG